MTPNPRAILHLRAQHGAAALHPGDVERLLRDANARTLCLVRRCILDLGHAGEHLPRPPHVRADALTAGVTITRNGVAYRVVDVDLDRATMLARFTAVRATDGRAFPIRATFGDVFLLEEVRP